MTHRSTLSRNQIHVLTLLYKFRFLSAGFLSKYKKVSYVAAHKSLEILKSQEYIASHYDRTYKLLGKGARYYLTPKGMKYLRDVLQIDEKVIHTMYKNKSVTEEYIDHYIDTCNVFLHFRESYPNVFDIFAKTELAGYDSIPSPCPDLFLVREKESDLSPKHYFIELHHDKLPINARRRLSELLEHYDAGEWTEGIYPVLCFALKDAKAEASFVSYAVRILYATGMEDEITILTTTMSTLNEANPAVWSRVQEPRRPVAL